jgi:Fic family protein
MLRGLQGTLKQDSTLGQVVEAFVPRPLPPTPEVDMRELWPALSAASFQVGKLSNLSGLSETDWVLDFYMKQEAVLSSQIEGTQSSLADLLIFEGAGLQTPSDDIAQVLRYAKASAHAVDQLKRGVPICRRLIEGAHAILLESGRGATKNPGRHIRTSQNIIRGPHGIEFVPPPFMDVPDAMASLEAFINADGALSPERALVTAAFAHVQFETIHPFLDGNGRLGRLLIALILVAAGLLPNPTLFLSLFFKKNRERYYELLQTVRITGDWEAWMLFFLEGVSATAKDAVIKADQAVEAVKRDRECISGLGRATGNVMRLHELLTRQPFLSIGSAAKSLKLAVPTASKAMRKLQDLGVVSEFTGRRWGRLFEYSAISRMLETPQAG